MKNNNCPDFPFFGAKYPDATCIDGKLWDLDKCDENGLISNGENPPCPFCQTELFIDYITSIDDIELEELKNDTNLSEDDKSDILGDGITKADAIKIAEKLKQEYL